MFKMDREDFDDIFDEDGWIVAKKVDGKIKITMDQNATEDFEGDNTNWKTVADEDSSSDDEQQQPNIKKKFAKIVADNWADPEKTDWALHVRDILNLKKPHELAESFFYYNVPVKKVLVCGRITSIEKKYDKYYRLVIDDGTSAILCMVKAKEENKEEPKENDVGEEEDEVSESARDLNKHLDNLIKGITSATKTSFEQSELGTPVKIRGFVQEFKGKIFVFAHQIQRLSEPGYLSFLHFISSGYESRAMFLERE